MPFNFPNNPTVNQTSTQNGRVYVWNGKVWNLAPDFGASVSVNVVRALVCAGGGPGSNAGSTTSSANPGGGGGGVIDTFINITSGELYNITVGAGGTGSSIGSFSQFGSIVAVGGGAGTALSPFLSGGTGPGTRSARSNPLTGNIQGFGGGAGVAGTTAGGGGGAGGIGGDGVTGVASGNGGIGKLSDIKEPAYYYGGGGGGGAQTTGTTCAAGSGGLSGGGNGAAASVAPSSGVANSGGGGGGSRSGSGTAGSGGSGIVVLRMSSAITPTLSAGLVYNIEIFGSVEIITITGGTGNITFN